MDVALMQFFPNEHRKQYEYTTKLPKWFNLVIVLTLVNLIGWLFCLYLLLN